LALEIANPHIFTHLFALAVDLVKPQVLYGIQLIFNVLFLLAELLLKALLLSQLLLQLRDFLQLFASLYVLGF
jgi:hypothetical protein